MRNVNVCICNLSIQPAMPMWHIFICGLLRYTIFSTLSHKRHDFRKEVTENQMCSLIFSTTLSEIFLILRRNEWDMIKMCIGLHLKYPLFLSDFNENWIFSTDFWKIHKYQISWKPFLWESNFSMQKDWRTDMTKLIVAFRNFANAPKNDILFIFYFSRLPK